MKRAAVLFALLIACGKTATLDEPERKALGDLEEETRERPRPAAHVPPRVLGRLLHLRRAPLARQSTPRAPLP